MSNQFTVTAPQAFPSPIVNGSDSLYTPATITASSPTMTAQNIYSNLITITLTPYGTLTSDATVTLEGQINGSSFFPITSPSGTPYTWTGTQINASGAGGVTGLLAVLQIKAVQIRFVLTPGSTTGTNGVIVRILD